MQRTRFAPPVMIRRNMPVIPLQRVQLGDGEHDGGRRERFIQDLVHEHPEIIPLADIEPAFLPLIPICRELQTSAGYLDNLWLTPSGGIVLGECKLFRNPDARREVIAQTLDYAAAVAKLTYPELEGAVRTALSSPTASLWSLVAEHTDLEEAQFIDAVERRLRKSRFLLLVIGDGIQEGVEALTSHLQLHAGLHVGLALIDLSVWRDPDGALLVVPRIPLRTVLVERGIVVVDKDGQARIEPPKDHLSANTDRPRTHTISETEFFDHLEQRRQGSAAMVRSFLDNIASLGIYPEFRKSLVLRWEAATDFILSPGYIETSGRVWLSNGWNSANRLGNIAAGDRYLERVASIVGGTVRRYEKNWPDVIGPDGRAVDVRELLRHADAWREAIAALMDETRAQDQRPPQQLRQGSGRNFSSPCSLRQPPLKRSREIAVPSGGISC